MNLLIKQKETCRLREGTNSCLYTLLYLKMDNQQGPTIQHNVMLCYDLLNVIWKPGWEESLGENGYLYRYA